MVDLNDCMCVLQVGFASEFGRQSLVSALSACNPAVRQLGVLLEHHSQVLSAAGTAPHDQGLGSPVSMGLQAY
jgi:hypothetical protein